MISPKKLIKMARKWQKLAAIRRKRISFPRSNEDLNVASTSNTSSTVDEGHFVVYTADQKRFVLPLPYLNNYVVRELFKMSEEEFGLSSDGPIMLPCDASLMEYVVTLIRRGVGEDLEKAFLKSIDSSSCSISYSIIGQRLASQPFLVCGC
ncbi:hypothetical protein FNV43_RR21895 [Rhamnella rubrinervis]|uniref:Uncharacterized protein n=1 Tax=Rhamnella rubrinervis TaxID=2594499 RepID=A0A8K0DVH6_9ROSA|nr:hypothetical protein FNV43_RR21895 [Rhamnella rubrinervis]